MLIQKFGGTSVGSPERMREVRSLICDGIQKIVVLSAVGGTTNKLASIGQSLVNRDLTEAKIKLNALSGEYVTFVNELLSIEKYNLLGHKAIENQLDEIRLCFGQDECGEDEEKIILAQGELMSTQLFTLYMEMVGENVRLLPALDFMVTNSQGDPDLPKIRKNLDTTIGSDTHATYYITQGYICRNDGGKVDNLQRGGSDYTATIIGAALHSEEIQIWTDIDGLHNNDPRVVEGTQSVRFISYREAAELAYFGAKILHPTCVIPAEQNLVPIRLKNTFEPQAEGTLISDKSSGQTVTAISAKDKITAIKIRSGRMLNAYGFLRKVFEVFEKYKTPIDMITTSEVSVSLTIDQTQSLTSIVEELKAFGEVSVEQEQTIICIVGDTLGTKPGCTAEILQALAEIPLRMVSYGGSNNNISVLIDSNYKVMALKSIQSSLFQNVHAVI
jgi:aspartate kinase